MSKNQKKYNRNNKNVNTAVRLIKYLAKNQKKKGSNNNVLDTTELEYTSKILYNTHLKDLPAFQKRLLNEACTEAYKQLSYERKLKENNPYIVSLKNEFNNLVNKLNLDANDYTNIKVLDVTPKSIGGLIRAYQENYRETNDIQYDSPSNQLNIHKKHFKNGYIPFDPEIQNVILDMNTALYNMNILPSSLFRYDANIDARANILYKGFIKEDTIPFIKTVLGTHLVK